LWEQPKGNTWNFLNNVPQNSFSWQPATIPTTFFCIIVIGVILEYQTICHNELGYAKFATFICLCYLEITEQWMLLPNKWRSILAESILHDSSSLEKYIFEHIRTGFIPHIYWSVLFICLSHLFISNKIHWICFVKVQSKPTGYASLVYDLKKWSDSDSASRFAYGSVLTLVLSVNRTHIPISQHCDFWNVVAVVCTPYYVVSAGFCFSLVLLRF
jgi:hypothetical protein